MVMALGLLLAMGGDLSIGPSFVQGAALFAAYLLLAWLSAADETQMEGFAVDAAFADSRRCIPGFLPQAGVYSRLDALGMPGICGDYFTDDRKDIGRLLPSAWLADGHADTGQRSVLLFRPDAAVEYVRWFRQDVWHTVHEYLLPGSVGAGAQHLSYGQTIILIPARYRHPYSRRHRLCILFRSSRWLLYAFCRAGCWPSYR